MAASKQTNKPVTPAVAAKLEARETDELLADIPPSPLVEGDAERQEAEQRDKIDAGEAKTAADAAQRADEFMRLKGDNLKRDQLVADPERTADMFLKLFGQHVQKKAQLEAIEADLPKLRADAARVQVVESRLDRVLASSESKWFEINGAGIGEMRCFAWPTMGLQRMCPTFIMFTDSDGKPVTPPTMIERANVDRADVGHQLSVNVR